MFSIAAHRLSRLLTFVFPAIVLVGCFGEGEGPTPIAGTPAPPPPPIPEGFCDVINFEDVCGPFTFTDFEGGAVSIIDNPDASGSNTSEKVARMQKFEVVGGGTFGGSTLTLPSGIDFSAGEAFTMQVWSQRQVPVLFKFEGLDQERSIDHSGGSMWQELCFDFSGSTSGPAASGLTVIFDISVMGNAGADPNNWTFYFDEITQVDSCAGGGGTTTLPVDFENDPTSYNFGADGGFGGGASAVIDNPDASGINTSAQVARMEKFAGETFGGSTLSLAGNVDFAAGEAITMKVWSSRQVPVLFKFEGLDQERSVDHPGGSTWEELCFDFTGSTTGPASNALTFIFDLGTAGDAGNDAANWTFYYDDIEQVASCGGGASAPSVSAPTPTQDAANVVSLFSDAYTDEMATWPTPWSVPNDTTSDVTIDGGLVREHLNVGFIGVEFQVDASSMTHLHLDVWTPDATDLVIKLVDFGGDGFQGTNPDTEGLLTFNASSTPALAQGSWVSLDIPLQDFLDNGLGSLADLNQIVLDPMDDGTALYVDNVYFYNDNAGTGSAPIVAPSTPTQNAANVVSLFSGAYSDVTVDTWRTDWSVGDLTDVTIDGTDVKQYTNLDFVGVEAVSSPIDASGMTHFRVDVWTPDATQIRIKLVDFGANGIFDGGDDTEAELVFDDTTTPALTQGEWVSLDIPLADFQAAGLTNTNTIAQIVFAASPPGSATVFVTNVYFYNANASGATAPTTAAPTPTQDAGDVISLYSDAYTDESTVWPTPWSVPNDMTGDVTIDGGLVKEHLATGFIGVEFQVDATGMTHLHLDVWTPDATALEIKLVDFGGDGFQGTNTDTEGLLRFDDASTPVLAQGSWVSLDIPLQDFLDAGLGSTADLNQMVLDPIDDGTALYVDNVYFYNDNAGGGATAPTTAAPTPTQDAGDVISLYSDAYTDESSVWPTPWSVPNDMTSDVTIDGGLVKEHLATGFIGVEFQVDATGMTHLHLDVWTPDATALLLKLVDFGGDGFQGTNTDTEGLLTFDDSSTPVLTQGTWVSLDIPLQDFLDNGLGSTADLNQIVLDPMDDGTALYIDNVYFYTTSP